jgi:hypothetical protein
MLLKVAQGYMPNKYNGVNVYLQGRRSLSSTLATDNDRKHLTEGGSCAYSLQKERIRLEVQKTWLEI